MLSKAQNIRRQSSREETDLDVGGQELEDVLNLGLEATGEHLVSLIQDEKLKVVCLEEASPHHVVHAAGGSDDDVLTLLEDADVLLYDGAANASVHLDAEVLADGVHDEGDLHGQLAGGRDDQGLGLVTGWVDALEGTDGEGTSLAGSGLRLRKTNVVVSFSSKFTYFVSH